MTGLPCVGRTHRKRDGGKRHPHRSGVRNSFRHVAAAMGVPRVVSPLHPMGRPMGPPGDTKRHQAVLESALDLLESATEGGALLDLGDRYRPGGTG